MPTEPDTTADDLLDTLKETWLTESDLEPLRALPPHLLAFVTGEVTAHAERVRESERHIYETLARITRFIPNLVLTRIAGTLSPYASARVAEYLEPKHAAALSKHYEPHYLSEVTLHLDAHAAARIAAHSDIDVLTRINDTLLSRRLYRRMAELSDVLDDRMLVKLAERMRDPEGIASVALHMRVLDKVRTVADHLDRKVLDKVRASLLRREAHALLAELDG
jgi:hypothetical protein